MKAVNTIMRESIWEIEELIEDIKEENISKLDAKLLIRNYSEILAKNLIDNGYKI